MTTDRVLYDVRTCWLGSVLVATTERGICALSLADAPEPLVAELCARYPDAEAADRSGESNRLLALAFAYLEDGTRPCPPLDLRGTPFQLRVWKELSEVPAGETITYTELAQRAEAPSAVRAVAAACGANRVAVLVPCHRVVGKGGELTGYRWGVRRKRALLERERLASGRGAAQEPLAGF